MNRIEVNYNVANDVLAFLKNYSDIHGIPSPGRHCNEITMPIVFLLTSYSYSSVYRDYVQAYKEKYETEGSEVCVMIKQTFVNI